MELVLSIAAVRCENAINTRITFEVRNMMMRLLMRYRLVLEGDMKLDDARGWYVQASEAYEKFRMRAEGDEEELRIKKYQAALHHTYLYCEERLKSAMESYDEEV